MTKFFYVSFSCLGKIWWQDIIVKTVQWGCHECYAVCCSVSHLHVIVMCLKKWSLLSIKCVKRLAVMPNFIRFFHLQYTVWSFLTMQINQTGKLYCNQLLKSKMPKVSLGFCWLPRVQFTVSEMFLKVKAGWQSVSPHWI